MFSVIVDIFVREDCVEQFQEAAVEQTENSRRLEPGCLCFEVLQNPGDRTHFILYESYADARTFYDEHRHTAHFADYAARTEPWVKEKIIRPLDRLWPQWVQTPGEVI